MKLANAHKFENMKKFIALAFAIVSLSSFSQEITKDWSFTSIKNLEGKDLFEINKTDVFTLKDNSFSYSLLAKDSLEASGNYIKQNNLLIFNYKQPKDTVRYYNIVSLTDTNLVLSENDVVYHFSSENGLNTVAVDETKTEISDEFTYIKPSEGFSPTTLWRGVLGMFVLIVIAFLFSKNRKAIDWKRAFLGLSLQLLIAIGVLKVPFIERIFDFIGKIFIEILNYTKAGSEFLFAGMVGDMNTFGYIFAFQVLPTIIFFSALTSLLFYLGIIQRIVKILAIVLSKFLGISGMESLSVAGNIFLGQTEAPLLIKAYLEKMNRSEMLLVMIGGMATVAGAVLAAYIGFLGGGNKTLELIFAKHLLAASVMAAPGAIVISKILYPQTAKVNTDVTVSQEKIGSNILDAIANGTTEGLRLAVNVGAMLLVFVAVIAMLNGILEAFGSFEGI